VPDHSAVLLSHAGQIAGRIGEGEQGDIERIADTDKAGSLVRSVDVQDAGQDCWLVRYDADGAAGEPGESCDNVFGIVWLYFEEVA